MPSSNRALTAAACLEKMQDFIAGQKTRWGFWSVLLYTNQPTNTMLSIKDDYEPWEGGNVTAVGEPLENWSFVTDEDGVAWAISSFSCTWFNVQSSPQTVRGYYCLAGGGDQLQAAEEFQEPAVILPGRSLTVRLVIKDRSVPF